MYEKKHKLKDIILIAEEKSLYNVVLISRKKDTKNKERKKKEKKRKNETYPLLTKPFLFFFLILIHINRTNLNNTIICVQLQKIEHIKIWCCTGTSGDCSAAEN